jgi:sulfate permease, SulP family
MKFALTVPDWASHWRNHVPIVDVLARYKRRDLSHDLFAGWVVSVITVPQAIAYAFLAGLPPQAGLYASIVPALLYAVLGSSPSLAVGPVAVIAIMVAEAVRTHAPAFSDAYLGVTAIICMQSAFTLWLLRLTKMGGIVNLLSHPVISGFINAAAIMIILSQLTALTGIPSADGSPFAQVRHLLTDLSAINPFALAIGCASFLVLWLVQRFGFYLVLPFLRRVGRNHPITRIGPMVVALLAIGAVLAFGLDHRFGVATVGPIDGGLPTLAWPPFDLALWLDVMPASAMIALVAYVQSFSIGTQLAHRKRQRINPNQELVALGAADFGAALTGGMPVAGSMSRSTGGGRTALTGVFCSLFVLVTVLWLTPYFSALPHAALAAIIIMSVSDFIDFSPVYRYWKFYRHDSITHVAALLAVLMFGVERGLLIGILVAVALFVRRSSRPHIAIVGRIGDSAHFRSELRHQVATHPHVMAVRIDENLYFANASLVETRLLRLVSRNAKIRHLLLVCSSINLIDTSGLEMLERVDRELMRSDVKLHLSEVKGPVMDQLNASNLPRELSGRIFFTTDEAMRDLEKLG